MPYEKFWQVCIMSLCIMSHPTVYCISLSVIPDPTALGIFAILQILMFIGAILHDLYTICFIGTAMLTVCAFDRDVWCRDIDSSPSPFSMWFLLVLASLGNPIQPLSKTFPNIKASCVSLVAIVQCPSRRSPIHRTLNEPLVCSRPIACVWSPEYRRGL
ncbi:hypothetical protein B0H13DRAFT_1967603 [Mycena leptocephala]|nr:hypothetical protein B0H13DRAFT_1967603 [Mycena leptocephala]